MKTEKVSYLGYIKGQLGAPLTYVYYRIYWVFSDGILGYYLQMSLGNLYIYSWQPLGPLLKVKLLVDYM